MEWGSSGSAGVPLDLSFGFDDPNFSDRTLLLHIIADADPWFPNLKRRRSDDLLSNASTDITLPPPPRVKTIHINSLILAARSPLFRKLFSNGMQESEQKHVTLRVEALEEVSFMDLLKFVYSNNLPTTLDALRNLLMMADKFEVDSCSRDCARALLKLPMTCKSALLYLDLPQSLLMSPTVEPLIEAAKNFLAAKFKDISKFEEEVLNSPLFGLQAVLSSDDLQVTSENIVYEIVLDWVNKHYSDMEERREILKTHLLHLVRFPFMTTTGLIEDVQTCKDIDPEVASKIVIRALSFKAETSSHRKRCLADECNAASRQFVERAYIHRPVKVVELELPHPKCVVFFYLTRNELKHIFPEGDIWSEPFVLGGHEFCLSANCSTGQPNNLQYFRLDLDVSESSTSTVKYEVSVIRKPHEDFEHWFRGKHTFIKTDSYKDLHREEWTRFIGDDGSYFINGILHLRAEFTIMR